MLNPDYLLRISEGSEEIASQLHNDIIKRIVNRIMLRIGRGEEYLLTSQDQWQILTLQQAGYLLEDIQQEIAKATKLQQTEIAEAMEDDWAIGEECSCGGTFGEAVHRYLVCKIPEGTKTCGYE